jgi:hypothetical protein
MKGPAAVAIVALGLIAALGAAGNGMAVTPLWRDGRMFVSIDAPDGLTPELRDGIHSGLSTSFSYVVDVRRHAFGWFSRTIASVTVTSTVQFDNLTRRYQLSRSFDGGIDDQRQTEDEDAMRRWLTHIERAPVAATSVLEANNEYAVRIRLYRSPRNSWFVLPWDRSAMVGVTNFTFLP